jgi:hypothetical protein
MLALPHYESALILHDSSRHYSMLHNPEWKQRLQITTFPPFEENFPRNESYPTCPGNYEYGQNGWAIPRIVIHPS